MEIEVEIAMRPESIISVNEMKSFFDQFVKDNNELFISSISYNMINDLQVRIMQIAHFPSPDYYSAIDNIKVTGNKPPIAVHCYFLHYDDQQDDIVDNDGEILSIATQTILPSIQFAHDWDSIIFDNVNDNIKVTLLNFMKASVLFADNNVCPETVTSNRIILLYGPPGTGKTTICHGLAQKLSILYSDRFSNGIILEVNTHSLFSKWFAESGKMVKKLFDRLNNIAEDKSILVFVLIDEVESIATARQSSLNGSDPSDAIRVVNALLTQLDKLRKRTNVIVMATSNLTECIDFAFLSRADMKQYIGTPSKMARYMIFKSCINELSDKGIIETVYDLLDYDKLLIISEDAINSTFPNTSKLLNSALLSEGLSGRILRRLPFLAFVYRKLIVPTPFPEFISALDFAISKQSFDQPEVVKPEKTIEIKPEVSYDQSI